MTTATTENYDYGGHTWPIEKSSSKSTDRTFVESACPVCGYRKQFNGPEEAAVQKLKEWIHRHYESCSA